VPGLGHDRPLGGAAGGGMSGQAGAGELINPNEFPTPTDEERRAPHEKPVSTGQPSLFP
jgi:hypothetical protein